MKMVSPLTAGGNGAVVITPENCVYQTERLIAAMVVGDDGVINKHLKWKMECKK